MKKSAGLPVQSAERRPRVSGQIGQVVSPADCRSAERAEDHTTRVSEQNQQDGAASTPRFDSESAELAKYRERERKNKARAAVQRAVLRGKIQKPTACARCRREVRLFAHHPRGYDNPLDVEWLCHICHTADHLPRSAAALDARVIQFKPDPTDSHEHVWADVGGWSDPSATRRYRECVCGRFEGTWGDGEWAVVRGANRWGAA